MTRSVRSLLWAGGIFAATAVASDDPTVQECQDYLNDELQQCNSIFHNPDHADYNNQNAYETCIDGAQASLIACLSGHPGSADARSDFIDAIKDCIRLWSGNTPALEACLLGALNTYRVRLGLSPIDIGDNCGPSSMGVNGVAPIDSLITAALAMGIADGKYPVEVETSLSFQAGVSATNSYNIANQPCIKQAELIAIRNTRQGQECTSSDADTETVNGVFFDLPIFANRTVDTKTIDIFVIYYDENSGPAFIEYATLSILDSTVAGDWNRDEVLNSQDIIDFLGSYDAQTGRADLNADGQVDTQDTAQYLNSITE